MRALAVAVLLVLAACGGDGGDFDEDGLRQLIEEEAGPGARDADVDAMVDAVRDACEATESEQQIMVDGTAGSPGPSFRDLMEVACPDDVLVP